MKNLHYFTGSLIVTVLGLIGAFIIGLTSDLGGIEALFLTGVLAILEISLSFDNTVVNATVLKEMTPLWRHRFITWGMVIAVFGMRILFPIIIVCIVARIDPISAIDMAIYHQHEYAHYMEQAHTSLMGFGGAFLLMVGLGFFLDADKDHHWITPLEKLFSSLGKIHFISVIITVAIALVIGLTAVHPEDKSSFFISAVCGFCTYIAIEKLAEYMEKKEEKREEEYQKSATKGVATSAAKSGFAMFMYLEILDSSFSFDGVIGAFAITTNLLIIAIGLAIGAMFVRSLTIMLVEKNTLSEYEFLEHGAFYAIVSLAIIMMLKTFTEIPETITGTIGALFIGIAFLHSLKTKKKRGAEDTSEDPEDELPE